MAKIEKCFIFCMHRSRCMHVQKNIKIFKRHSKTDANLCLKPTSFVLKKMKYIKGTEFIPVFTDQNIKLCCNFHIHIYM